MNYLKLFEQFKEIESLCLFYNIYEFSINNDGSVDVNDDVYINSNGLDNIPINFNKVNGCFDCSNNELLSLLGCPNYVGGYFNCAHNSIDSLEYLPNYIGEDLFLSSNKLTSLDGSPKIVNGDFQCQWNLLTTLEGGPKHVNGDFYCSDNQLTSLKYCPEYVGGNFICTKNKLKSLEHIKDVRGIIDYIKGNDFPDELLRWCEYPYQIVRLQDEFMIWNSDGSLNKHNFQELLKEVDKSKKVRHSGIR